MSNELDPGADLSVLRLSFATADFMSSSATPTPNVVMVACELQESRNTVGRWHVSARQLAVPEDYTVAARVRYSDLDGTFPVDVAQAIVAALHQRAQPRAPLWLEFVSPCGTLPLAAWERMLQPLIEVSVFRLPYLGVEAVASLDSLDLAICASSPRAKIPISLITLIPPIVARMLSAGPQSTRIHVFTERATLDELRTKLNDSRVLLYDPSDLPSDFFAPVEELSETSATEAETSSTSPGISDSDVLRNPWLRWMSYALGDLSVDGVHFISHGYLALGRGMLALAESPVRNSDRAWSRFIGARELSMSLSSLGAWLVGITAPDPNFSVIGLRLLLDQLARVRTGPVFLHDMAAQPGNDNFDALGSTYRFLCGAGGLASQRAEAPPPTSPAISLVVPPARTGSVESLERTNLQMLGAVTRGRASASIASGGSVHAWLASAQRTIERSTAELLEARTPVDSSARAGVERALKLISDAVAASAPAAQAAPPVARHAGRPAGGSAGGTNA